ncbi:c-type cytochrome biogenesis protein CcsB [Anthocerotibacter panamensis]|uniref:c-type cytochrome biogenesis protein CcsB n=1 Tax=Anthocerotibacter panamensis TaxID=2857077 RepID=UPI001C406D67|nr:c-type cytochrome biogenesis protein CcsB [Anthocerotibacter panamensis]
MDNLVALQRTLDDVTCYVLIAATLLYWVHAVFPKPAWVAEVGTAAVAIASLTSGSLLVARWIESGHPFPVSNLYESLFFLCWCLTFAQLCAEYLSRQKVMGLFTMPFATATAAFASFYLPAQLQVSAPLVPALDSNWLMLHVSVMVFSYGFLLAAGGTSMAYLWVTRKDKQVELKGNSIGSGGMRRVEKTPVRSSFTPAEEPVAVGGPSLSSAVVLSEEIAETPSLQALTLAETLDNVSYRLVGLGFPLLTVGIIAGAVWANEAWGSYWSWDPKETWALITWLVFAAYLHARLTKGWQGKRPAWLAVLGFSAVWVTYLGVNFLAQGLHSYGFFLKQ